MVLAQLLVLRRPLQLLQALLELRQRPLQLLRLQATVTDLLPPRLQAMAA
jgi:hypothetical protein